MVRVHRLILTNPFTPKYSKTGDDLSIVLKSLPLVSNKAFLQTGQQKDDDSKLVNSPIKYSFN